MKTATALALLLESGDHKVMLRVHRWPAPKWLRVAMLIATRCGDGWLWGVFGFTILFLGGEPRFRALATALSAVATGIVLFRWLKKRINRRRPCMIEPHCWATILPPDQFSFPSGHTITAFAVAGSLGHFYPSLELSLWFCAANVGLSRVLLGMHFVSDVIAGALLGILLSTIWVWVINMIAAL